MRPAGLSRVIKWSKRKCGATSDQRRTHMELPAMARPGGYADGFLVFFLAPHRLQEWEVIAPVRSLQKNTAGHGRTRTTDKTAPSGDA